MLDAKWYLFPLFSTAAKGDYEYAAIKKSIPQNALLNQ